MISGIFIRNQYKIKKFITIKELDLTETESMGAPKTLEPFLLIENLTLNTPDDFTRLSKCAKNIFIKEISPKKLFENDESQEKNSRHDNETPDTQAGQVQAMVEESVTFRMPIEIAELLKKTIDDALEDHKKVTSRSVSPNLPVEPGNLEQFASQNKLKIHRERNN